MLELAAGIAIATAIAAPHAAPLGRVTPMLAVAVWLLTLAVRALLALGCVVFFVLFLPETDLFATIESWCLHDLVPILATDVGLSGHHFAHAANLLPAILLAGSLIGVVVGSTRAWLALRRQLRRSLGEGPWGSTVVPDPRVVVAVTAFGRGRVVLSPAALRALDGDELKASVAHEIGHLRRRHRPLLLLGALLAALARPLPGTHTARAALVFHLERDADQYAVRETHNPLALASAICKAGASQLSATAPLGGRGRVGDRLAMLVEGRERPSAGARRIALALAVGLTVIVVALAGTLPAWAMGERQTGAEAAPAGHCSH